MSASASAISLSGAEHAGEEEMSEWQKPMAEADGRRARSTWQNTCGETTDYCSPFIHFTTECAVIEHEP